MESTTSRGDRTDEAALREFLATQYPRLVAAVGLISGSHAAAEDAVQEALARAWERSERGERIESLAAWVTRVAVNLVRSGFRRAMAERRARERLAGRGAPAERDPAVAVEMDRALRALPRRQREMVVLRYYLDLDVREISTVLGVHEGTVKTSLHRARRTLASALGEREDVEEANDRAGR
jgi:RNA polymerase sigma factor (sigma-70 family)